MDKGYECHLTFRADAARQVENQANGFWKFSRIEGDPVLGQELYCYLTGWSPYMGVMEDEMRIKIDQVRSYGLPLVRAKIEHIIYDQRY